MSGSNGNSNVSSWHIQKNTEGQIGIYDQAGFVAAVDDYLVAHRLFVELQNEVLASLEDSLRHEQWGCDINFAMWQAAQQKVTELKAAIMAVIDMLNATLPDCEAADEVWALLEALEEALSE